eukprot:g28521.t1
MNIWSKVILAGDFNCIIDVDGRSGGTDSKPDATSRFRWKRLKLPSCTTSSAPLRTERSVDTPGSTNVKPVFFSDHCLCELYDMKPTDRVASQLLLSSIMEVLDNSRCKRLDQMLSLDELTKALESLEKNKTPRSDGLPAELYSALWDVIGQDLLEVYHNMLLADYKIQFKVITIQVRSALGSVIQPDQTCAVPGRTDPEIFALLWDMITYVQDKEVDTCLISLDQEKALQILGPLLFVIYINDLDENIEGVV